MTDTIEFTHDKYRVLRHRYEDAVRNGIPQFEFEGHEVLTAYAKYLLEYLKPQFGESDARH